MLDITLNWKPDPSVLTKLIELASQQQKPLKILLDEAIQQYFQVHDKEILAVDDDDDPIVGFYSGSPDLASNAENIFMLQEL